MRAPFRDHRGVRGPGRAGGRRVGYAACNRFAERRLLGIDGLPLPALVAAGLDDHTVTGIEPGPDGSAASNATPGPGRRPESRHAIYVEDAVGLKVVGTGCTSRHSFHEGSGF